MSYKTGLFQKEFSFKSLFGQELWNILQKGVKNLFNSFTGSAMTDAEKESSELDFTHQSALNEQQYDMKTDFYERYESPVAQVRQYQQAGLNPMMLASSGASVSATGGTTSGNSGSQSGSNPSAFVSLLGTLLNYKVQKQSNDNEAALIASTNQRNLGAAESSFASAERTRTLMDSEKRQIEANIAESKSRLQSQDVQRALDKAKIKTEEAEAALKIKEASLKAIEEKYGDDYWKNVVALQNAQTDLATSQSSHNKALILQSKAEVRRIQQDIHNMEIEGTGLVIQNGILGREFQMLGYDLQESEVSAKFAKAREIQGQITGYVDSICNVVQSVTGVGNAVSNRMNAYNNRVSSQAAGRRAGSYERHVDWIVRHK